MQSDSVMLRCVCFTYDPDGKVPYNNTEDFLKMCRDVFEEEPELTSSDELVWYDKDGRKVLVMWVDED